MSLIMETQEDSLDLTYLKEAALGPSNELWPLTNALDTPDTRHGLADTTLRKGSLGSNEVIIAAEITSQPHGLGTKSVSRPTSLPRHPSANVTLPLSSQTETWTTVPELPGKNMTATTESPPTDTQVVSQSAYDNLLKGSAPANDEPDAIEGGTTQKTLREGDTGHIDLFADFDDTLHVDKADGEAPVGPDALDAQEQAPEDSSPTHYPSFPESQRFLDRTPAGRSNHDFANHVDAVTPSLPTNPFVKGSSKTPGSVMALSQVFNATQASSSPLANVPRPEPSSDMPSPNLPIQGRQIAMSLPSPLRTSSPVANRESAEPLTNYLSMKDSQAVREKAILQRRSLSATNHWSGKLSDDEFLDDEIRHQKQMRQREIENQVKRQFASITAPVRPNGALNRRSTASISPTMPVLTKDKSPSSLRDRRDSEPNIYSDNGRESELETEQEEEHISRSYVSQKHQSSGEEDKENIESGPVITNTAFRAHDALSQALDMDASPSTHNSNFNGRYASVHGEPQGPHPEIRSPVNQVDASQVDKVPNTQPSVNNESTTEDKATEIQDNEERQPLTPRPAAHTDCPERRPAEPASSPYLKAQIRSSPPLQRSQPDEDDLEVADTLEQPHETCGPSASNSPTPINLANRANSDIQRAEIGQETGNIATQGHPENNHTNSANNQSSMRSLIFETPTHGTTNGRSSQRRIPETSPKNRPISTAASVTNRPHSEGYSTPPRCDDDNLPEVPRFSNERQIAAFQLSGKNISERFKAVLSSPSGRPRRSMTDIASDQSPRPVLPDVPLDDIGLITADDRAFQSVITESEYHAVKRRRGNDGQSIRNASAPLPMRERSATPVTTQVEETGQNIAREPGNGQPPEAPPSDAHEISAYRNRFEDTSGSKTIWEVDVSPQKKTQGRELVRTSRAFRKPFLTREKLNYGRKGQSFAHAVVIRNPSSSSPVPTEIIASSDNYGPLQSDRNSEQRAEVSETTSDTALGTSNQVFAFFNGQPHGYYTATCVGVSDDVGRRRYLIRFEDSEHPDKIDADGVKRLELMVNDVVKVDLPNIPKIPHVVMGLSDKLDSEELAQAYRGELLPMTDIYGHRSATLVPKHGQNTDNPQQTITVPISKIYLDKQQWARIKDRQYTYTPLPCHSAPRIQTPTEPKSVGLAPSIVRTPRTESGASGLLSGMAFAVSISDKKELSRIEPLITKNGGLILKSGFDELFDLVLSSSVSLMSGKAKNGDGGLLKLTSKGEQLSFVCLLTDGHSRRPKYFQALALNLPCLAGCWLDHCLASNEILDWEPYLLPAGESMFLGGMVRSRILSPNSPTTALLRHTVSERPKLLAGQSVLLVTGRGQTAEQRRPFSFFTYALDPRQVDHVQDFQSAIDMLGEHQGTPATNKGGGPLLGWDWIYVGEEKAANEARDALTKLSQSTSTSKSGSMRGRGRPPKNRSSLSAADLNSPMDTDEYLINGKKIRILENEFICQILILGKMFDRWPEIQQKYSRP